MYPVFYASPWRAPELPWFFILLRPPAPRFPPQVIGLNNVPIAGDEFEVVDSLDAARERADACAESLRAARISAKVGEGKVTLSSIASAVSAGGQSGLDMHQLNIILKVDVQVLAHSNRLFSLVFNMVFHLVKPGTPHDGADDLMFFL